MQKGKQVRVRKMELQKSFKKKGLVIVLLVILVDFWLWIRHCPPPANIRTDSDVTRDSKIKSFTTAWIYKHLYIDIVSNFPGLLQTTSITCYPFKHWNYGFFFNTRLFYIFIITTSSCHHSVRQRVENQSEANYVKPPCIHDYTCTCFYRAATRVKSGDDRAKGSCDMSVSVCQYGTVSRQYRYYALECTMFPLDTSMWVTQPARMT